MIHSEEIALVFYAVVLPAAIFAKRFARIEAIRDTFWPGCDEGDDEPSEK